MTSHHHITLSIESMSCDHCVERVTDTLEAVDGVAEARVDLEAGEAAVMLSQHVTRGRLAAAVEDAGYQVATDAR